MRERYQVLWLNVLKACMLIFLLAIGSIVGISAARMLTLHLPFAGAMRSTLRDWIWLSGVIGGLIGHLVSTRVRQR